MFINSSFHGKQELAKTRTIRINKKEGKSLLKPMWPMLLTHDKRKRVCR